MSTFRIGDTVRVLAESFARETGTVTNTDDGKEWYFDPTDELELITDEQQSPRND